MDKLAEFKLMITELNPLSKPTLKVLVFEVLRDAWSELGEQLELKDEICRRLTITPELFNICLLHPETICGDEGLSRLIRPGWIKTYLEYTVGNEAPEEFHLWVALTILGTTLRRKVFIDNFFFRIYPNLFTVLVAPPGVCKKTTAANIGANILRDATDVRIFSEKITPEALAKSLSKTELVSEEGKSPRIEAKSQGLLFAPELTVFLGREQYNESLVLLLTRIYDCPDKTEFESIKHSTIPLRNVFVSLLGCTTPSELQLAIPASAGGGGLLSRMTMIYKASTPRCYPVPVMDDPLRRELLISQLREINEKEEGQFLISDKAMEWWNEYYVNHKKRMESSVASYAEREPQNVLRLAMILSVAEGLPKLLEVDVLKRAFQILTIASNSSMAMTKAIGTNERGQLQHDIIEYIRKSGGTRSRSSITKRFYGRAKGRDIEEAMQTLEHMAHLLVSFKSDDTLWYRLKSLKEERGD
jgi:hypothetical protein